MKEKITNFMGRFKSLVLNHKLPAIIIAVILVLGIAGGITACCLSHKNTPITPDVPEETTTAQVQETTAQPTDEITTTEQETTTADLGFRNPLTGELTETDISNNRPYFVMLNALKDALPQRGNSQADLLIEMMEEGGITRVVGVYQSLDGVGELGSIRSTREYFYSWALSFDGIMSHAGGDSWVLKKLKKSGYPSLDAINNAGGAYYRDSNRQQYLANEHTMFTTGERLLNQTANCGIRTTIDPEADITRLAFTEDGTPKNGTDASVVKVTFSGYKNTSFHFNEVTKQYDVFFWENGYVDEANENAQVAVTNVLILPVPNWNKVDGYKVNRQKYDMSGGEGYFVCGGKCEKITWTKGDYNNKDEYANPLHLYDAEGNELKLGIGKTYICVVNNTSPIEME